MIQLGLIGYPLAHSLSPRLHQAALHACDLQGDYSLFPVEPDNIQGLEAILDRVRAGEITGLNVTIPHKQTVIPLVDALTPTARAIGAINTIYLRDGSLIGDNTDAAGFRADLKKHLSTVPRRHGKLTALVLGAGGSARAIVYALVNDGWEVKIAARRVKQAHRLALSYPGNEIRIANLKSLQTNLPPLTFDLLVNTTPVGMAPNIDQSPWPENLAFPERAVIYDLVYNPRETKLVRDACLQGRLATTGLGMLIEQAALSFEIWTGHRPLAEAMFDALSQDAW
ncbi:MAG TPA: shikimate dehydrogenase [Anaerolineales bacterium]|nr:shikimate dehydrogenase [Anaerolineales bacterium]